MSRLKNFARGVVSSYVQLAANILFTLASVPLALHYLTKEEFALWALVTQITGYFALIDAGMTISVSRILADYKDQRDGGQYGGVLKAGALVFTLQGAVIAVATLLLASPLATAFEIGAALRPDFIFLLQGHGLLLAFAFVTKIAAAPFWGFQRFDVLNVGATVGFLSQLAVLWLGFSAGWGLKSMLAAYAAVAVVNALWWGIGALRLGFFPPLGAWGRIERGTLRELFTYGRDMFLMAIGSQLLSASQIMIVTRLLGLEAAATWAICSKLFTLAQMVVGKVFDNSTGAFIEMFVRGEHDRFKARFRDLIASTASLGVSAGVIAAVVNAGFVAAWALGRVAWPPLVDGLMGILLGVACVTRCFAGLASITKDLRHFRFVFLFEGLSFVALAWMGGSHFGFAGIAAASIVASLLWSGLYGFFLSRRMWECSTRELLLWLSPAGRVALGLLPAAVAARWWLGSGPGVAATVTVGGGLGLLVLGLVWWVGFPPTLKTEVLRRVRAR